MSRFALRDLKRAMQKDRKDNPPTQLDVLKYLHGHTCGKVGRDINGNVARALAKLGLAVRKPSVGPHGGKGVWYDITMAGIERYESMSYRRKSVPRTHDEDLAGALKERTRAIMLHEFTPRRGIAGHHLCSRCGQTKEVGAHPQPTKREVEQKQREVMDRIIANAEQDYNSLENNLSDMNDEYENYTFTKSQKQRIRTLKDDIENLLDTTDWP